MKKIISFLKVCFTLLDALLGVTILFWFITFISSVILYSNSNLLLLILFSWIVSVGLVLLIIMCAIISNKPEHEN